MAHWLIVALTLPWLDNRKFLGNSTLGARLRFMKTVEGCGGGTCSLAGRVAQCTRKLPNLKSTMRGKKPSKRYRSGIASCDGSGTIPRIGRRKYGKTSTRENGREREGARGRGWGCLGYVSVRGKGRKD